MLSVFKERLQLLRISLVNSYQQDTAYFWNNLSTLVSTILYCVTYLVFLNVIFANVNTIAGYTRDQMLLFAFIGNFMFYLIFIGSYNNLDLLRVDVNRGNLDLLLTKPLPLLFYTTTRKLSVLTILQQGTPTTIILAFAIHWHTLHIAAWPLLSGILIFICGIFLFHTIQFFLMLPVFWFGESAEFFDLSYPLSDYEIPYEGWPHNLKIALTVVLPILASAAIPASVILGKSDPNLMLFVVLTVTAGAVLLRGLAWKWALRNYTSASS